MENLELKVSLKVSIDWLRSTLLTRSSTHRGQVSMLNNYQTSSPRRDSTLFIQEMTTTDMKIQKKKRFFSKVTMINKIKPYWKEEDKSIRDIHFWIDFHLRGKELVPNFH